MRKASVERFRPRRTATSLEPASTHLVSFSVARISARSLAGFVANFAQEAMQGQLPLSKWELSGQRVEQFGRSEALFPGLYDHLSFLDHVHEFNPDQGVLG